MHEDKMRNWLQKCTFAAHTYGAMVMAVALDAINAVRFCRRGNTIKKQNERHRMANNELGICGICAIYLRITRDQGGSNWCVGLKLALEKICLALYLKI